ncbi:hypothetical protein M3Y98_01159700 [Aphelenchoides besseyi]|nr:hypothetical protein M3Y98_01159700 [Aphelenchoides besseyi]
MESPTQSTVRSVATVCLKPRIHHDDRPCTSSATLRLSLELDPVENRESSIASPLSTGSCKSAAVRDAVESMVNEVSKADQELTIATITNEKPSTSAQISSQPLEDTILLRCSELDELAIDSSIFNPIPTMSNDLISEPPQSPDEMQSTVEEKPPVDVEFEEPKPRSESIENLDPQEVKKEEKMDIVNGTTITETNCEPSTSDHEAVNVVIDDAKTEPLVNVPEPEVETADSFIDMSESLPQSPKDDNQITPSDSPPPSVVPSMFSWQKLISLPNVPPPRRPPKSKTKVKRQRPPNLPPINQIIEPPSPMTPSASRKIENLRLGVVQIRNLQITPMPQFASCSPAPATSTSSPAKKNNSNSPGSTSVSSVLRVHIKIDGKEVFQTTPIPTADNCVLSGEFVQVLPPNFHTLQFVIVETLDGRITRQLGRRSLKRREILGHTEEELWLTINPPLQTPVPGQPFLSQQPVCEELGQICLDISFDPLTKELEFRVLNCTAWKRWANSPAPPVSSSPLLLHRHQLHPQLLQHRSLPGDSLYASNSSILIEQDTGSSGVLLGTPQLSKKSAKFAISPKLSRKTRNLQHQTATGSLPLQSPVLQTVGSLDRKRQTSLVNQPLPRPEPPAPAPFGSPGSPLYLSACVMTPQGQSAIRKLRIVERRGLEPVRIDCRAIASHVDGRYEPPATAPIIHPRLGVPLTPTYVEPNSALCLKIASEPHVDDASCYGSVHVELDERTMLPVEQNSCGPNWYSLKSRSKQAVATTGSICAGNAVQPVAATAINNAAGSASTKQNALTNDENVVGEMRIRLCHYIEDVLPYKHYQPLHAHLLESIGTSSDQISLMTLIQQLPVDLEVIAKPLMKVFAETKQMGAFFSNRVSGISCKDENTLFRSQSMTSKIVYEMMKFVGQEYLTYAMKPLIDLIYAERECCEIDPARLKGVSPEVLERNQRQFLVYAELAFARVVDTASRCPPIMREVFHELRSVVDQFYPHRDNMGRLAVSSFLIMRFFSAAIMSPKSYGLKREAPDAEVNRTLTLISKTLQRLCNCVVSDAPLTIKEQWLNPMLERLLDDAHRTAMIEFLDYVSTPASTSESRSPTSPLSRIVTRCVFDEMEGRPVVLKDGQMVERRSGSDKKRSFKNLIHQKRRYVTLTENELSWQKMKENGTDLELKGSYSMADITAVTPLAESKHTFCVSTLNSEVHFQANNPTEMNEWMVLIHKQQLRHMMTDKQSKRPHHHKPTTLDIDVERELEAIHSALLSNVGVMSEWKQKLEIDGHTRLRSEPNLLDKLIDETDNEDKQKAVKNKIHAIICQTILTSKQIEHMRNCVQ